MFLYIILAGHGSKTSIQFGPRNQLTIGKVAFAVNTGPKDHLDLSYEKHLKQINFGKAIVRGGYLLLNSCKNGKGRRAGKNMANMMHRVVPHVHVLSVDESFVGYLGMCTGIKTCIKFKSIIWVRKYAKHHPRLYHIRPKRVIPRKK
ncbi:MAG: hypothetical protein ABIE74_05955 [Pseudomonadota bacterium]